MILQFDQDIQSQTHTTSTEPLVTDEQLMLQITHKNDAALAMLLERHMPLLRTIVSRMINNNADVDDLMQQIFLEIWNQAERYDEQKGKALGWIVTLARRRAIDKLRKRQAYFRVEERLRAETEHDAEHTPTSQNADAEAVNADHSEILQRVISTLPEPQQEAIQLAFYKGMSQREIASITGIPLGTIKTRIELAVRKVRNALLALGGEQEWAPSHA